MESAETIMSLRWRERGFHSWLPEDFLYSIFLVMCMCECVQIVHVCTECGGYFLAGKLLLSSSLFPFYLLFNLILEKVHLDPCALVAVTRVCRVVIFSQALLS